MKFDSIVRLSGASKKQVKTSCNSRTGTLTIVSGSAKSIDLIIGGDTNYDQKKGNAENNYSFKGVDPGPKVEKITSQAAARSVKELRAEHIKDYTALSEVFSLNLPDTAGSEGLEMSELIDNYDISVGDPYLESLLFEYGRYLLIGSSRPGTLPSNLLGKWSELLTGPWSSDYHLDINLQMNYWHADITGLGDVQDALWDYLEDTWVPRGKETAYLLYGAPDGAYVVHDEINIFGHTAMKSDPSWANCKNPSTPSSKIYRTNRL
jgi:alpha-L-fucosidase 2